MISACMMALLHLHGSFILATVTRMAWLIGLQLTHECLAELISVVCKCQNLAC